MALVAALEEAQHARVAEVVADEEAVLLALEPALFAWEKAGARVLVDF